MEVKVKERKAENQLKFSNKNILLSKSMKHVGSSRKI